jgi:hypothetical protein
VNVWTMTSYAVTDSSGSYRLDDIPVGTAEVFASALGYTLYGPHEVTVTSGAQTTLPITLSLTPQGNISGTVKELYGSALYPARIVELNGGVAYTDAYGRYTLYNVPFGLTDVTAYADSHISSTDAGVSVPSGGTVSGIDFNLPFVGQSSTYEFTFDDGTAEGFTTFGDQYGHNFWHVQNDNALDSEGTRFKNYFNRTDISQTRKVYLADSGSIPFAHSGHYYCWYGQTSPPTVEASYIGNQDPGDMATTESGTGGISANGQANSGTLESPVLDLTGYTFGKLSFWTWWEIEGKNPAQGKGFDAMYIYISSSTYTSWTLLGY